MTEPVSTQPKRNQSSPGQPVRQDGLVSFYPIRYHNLKKTIGIPAGIILILISIIALLYGAFITWTAMQRFGRAVILRTLPIPLLIFIGGLVIGSLILFLTTRHGYDGIEIGPYGLSFKNGKYQKNIRWESITRLDARINLIKFATSVIDVQSRAELETVDGETFKITDQVTNSQELILRCREAILPRLFQKAQHALRQGQKISFHRDLVATPQALLIQKMPYYWQDIEPKFKKRKFALLEKSSSRELISLPINQLENADILLSLLENPPLKS